MIAKPLTELTIKHGPNKIIWTDIHDPSKRQRLRFGLVENGTYVYDFHVIIIIVKLGLQRQTNI